MLKNSLNNFEKKSPKQRFLFIIGMLFFFLYLFMGVMVIFWEIIFAKKFPFSISSNYRIALGVVLIAYSCLRAYRFINSDNESDE
jgi:uncharacterized membrane protein (DUF485 family)